MNSQDQEEYEELVAMFGIGITKANRKERTMSQDSTEPIVKQKPDNQIPFDILTGKLTSNVKEENKQQKTKKKIKRGQTQRADQNDTVNPIDKALGFGEEEEEDKFVMPNHIREKILGSMSHRLLAEQKHQVSKSAIENLKRVQTLFAASRQENS